MNVTLLWGSLLALLYVVLSLEVVRHRRRAGVGIGHGQDKALRRSIRVHANFGEYVPFCVILLGLLEADGAPALVLHGFGATLLLSRVLHRVGLGAKPGTSIGRFWGAAGTIALLALAAGWGVFRALA